MHRLISLLILLALAAANTGAGEFPFESGLRYGFSYSHQRIHEFKQAEVFVNWNLPWQWNFATGWSLQPQLGLSAGWLQQRHDGGFIATFGPNLILRRKNIPFALVGGAGLTALGRSAYEARDFGSSLQFTEHIGLNWEPTAHFFLGYRFQHMSNAGLNLHNPGLNLHMLAAGFRF